MLLWAMVLVPPNSCFSLNLKLTHFIIGTLKGHCSFGLYLSYVGVQQYSFYLIISYLPLQSVKTWTNVFKITSLKKRTLKIRISMDTRGLQR